ncbi:diguanylate cyclase [Sulfurifustis variabilis]|uniref:Diguanylate cyclase n=1 Tax=Sulfurifustis variabilis TaxID=1675686 RepID=A0A1B4V731_9GAMM|nr:GGDEF domain-containing protein [Sulfurifustis variabilis]BAU49346.1 diguanylate cyclase [Sulfurifustis variabilis]
MALRSATSTREATATETQTTPSSLDTPQPVHAPARTERALRAMEEQLRTAQQQIVWLSEGNASLRCELALLADREARSHHDAYHDELTCLPNRRLLLDRLNQAIAQAVRQRKLVVLLLIDLDGFKAVNDKLGHAAGDKLLQTVAERLVACIRSADTACRYGGDEFVVMLPEIDGAECCASVERKIRTRLAAPYFVDGVEVTMTVSIGTAVFPVDAPNRSELLKQADVAMYRAKTGDHAPTR